MGVDKVIDPPGKACWETLPVQEDRIDRHHGQIDRKGYLPPERRILPFLPFPRRFTTSQRCSLSCHLPQDFPVLPAR